jgi:hypothetical protein
MSREELHDLLLGGVLVVLAYTLYKHFKQPVSTQPNPVQTAVNNAVSNATTSGPGSPFTTINDLLNGAVHEDIGGFGGTNYLALMEAPTVQPW